MHAAAIIFSSFLLLICLGWTASYLLRRRAARYTRRGPGGSIERR